MTTVQFTTAFKAIIESEDEVFLRRLLQACEVRLAIVKGERPEVEKLKAKVARLEAALQRSEAAYDELGRDNAPEGDSLCIDPELD